MIQVLDTKTRCETSAEHLETGLPPPSSSGTWRVLGFFTIRRKQYVFPGIFQGVPKVESIFLGGWVVASES